MENATLGPATYFVTEEKRWAISNVGLYRNNHSNYKGLGISEFLQTARNSSSSLRYYGLGLENGFYNITLLFAEIAILSDTLSWESLGRRVFDVYIQVLAKHNKGATIYLETYYSRFYERKYMVGLFLMTEESVLFSSNTIIYNLSK